MVKYPFDMLTMQLKECRQLMKCETRCNNCARLL